MKKALRADLINLLIKDGVAPSSASALLDQLAEPVGLRDTFAAAALQGLLAGYLANDMPIQSDDDCDKAYEFADAMLKARKKPGAV